MSRRLAFTLVELLVVIAIVMLLIAILLPSLSKAREQAKRTVCASNLHQVAIYLNVYANNFKGYVPIGYSAPGNDDEKQWNYTLAEDDTKGPERLVVFGRLYAADLISAPKALYCPSNTYPKQIYNNLTAGYENPWPPVSTKYVTRTGYSVRAIHPVDTSISLRWTYGSKVGFPNLPRMSDMTGFALASDVLSSPTYLNMGHRTGINVLYGDGSGRWIERRVLEAGAHDLDEITSSFRAAWNPNQVNMWQALDKK